MIRDISIAALAAASRGLEVRQKTIATNVANVETPGFKARRVDFESSLRRALVAGDPGTSTPSLVESSAPPRANGNNVNVDFELLESSETLLRQQLVANALSSRFGVLRTAIGR